MALSLPVALALILFVLTLGHVRVIDPDFPWHVEVGALIRAAGELPSREVFSHTAFGEPWIIQGWLSDVLLDVVWRSAGTVGIRLLVALVLVAIWIVMYRTIRLYVKRPETALLLSVLGVVLIQPYVYPRPTLATMLCLAVTVHSLFAFRTTGRLRWLFPLPLVFALWPNVHFGFPAGLGVVGLFLFSDLLQRLFPLARHHEEPGSLLVPGAWFVGLLCLIALGANPHGYGVLTHTIDMSIANAQSRIGEWQTQSFSALPGKLVYLGICALVVTRSFTRQGACWLDVVVPLVVIAAALSAGRHIPLMGIVLVPFLARAVAGLDRSVFAFRQRGTRSFRAAATADLSPRVSSFLNIALVVSAVIGTRFVVVPMADQTALAKLKQYQPSGAANFIVEHQLDGRLFNTYNGGGYLIQRLFPWKKVFIDGRYNPYPQRVLDDYFSIVEGKPDWFTKLQSYGVEIVLTESDASFRQLMMLRHEYRLVYDDTHFSVLVKDVEQYRKLPTLKPAWVR